MSQALMCKLPRCRHPLAINTGASGDQALDFADRVWTHAGAAPQVCLEAMRRATPLAGEITISGVRSERSLDARMNRIARN